MNLIPYSKQWLDEEDVNAVVNVLRGNWLTQGPHIEQFEKTVADYCGAQYAVAVNNGTSALHLACMAVGFGDGDILWTSPNTFVASANCGLYCGGTVDFVDIDPQTYNMSAGNLQQKLEKANQNRSLPEVVIPVHLSGQSCDMEIIAQLAHHYRFKIIEDASHALGARYRKTKVGCCAFSDMTIFSFHPVKSITTGEGGMILTNQKELYEKLIRLRNHGITRNPEFMQGEPHGHWYYQQVELGFNYRITDIQAALGTSQMRHLDKFVERRNYLTNRYNQLLHDLPLTLPSKSPDTYSACHLYVIRLRLDKIRKTRRQVFEELRINGIGVNVHYIPVHTQPYYKQLGFKLGDFPEAERYYQEAISIPLYYGLTDEEQDFVVDTIRKTLV
ncbi:MAG: UDP-4-amino-4,6-dideoxy-N-acetyl-beta-L-altrosamine transaminase [Candidatus Brocadiaceae bacterium]